MRAREAGAKRSGRILMTNHFGERFFEDGKGTPDFMTLWNKKNGGKSFNASSIASTDRAQTSDVRGARKSISCSMGAKASRTAPNARESCIAAESARNKTGSTTRRIAQSWRPKQRNEPGWDCVRVGQLCLM